MVQDATRPDRPRLGVRIGVGLIALGVLFVLVDVLPFFFGADDRPLWLNLACLLLPLGLVVAVWSALAQGRREQKDALRALEDRGRG
ncbi:hypothetical protein ACXR2U_07635 [Jatrophihabitans sp. YIM 134969]